MAGSFTNYAENKVIDHSLGVAAWTMPTTYLAAFTASPGETGGGTEVTGGSYARVALAGKIAAASAGASSNNAQISFPTATASWGTVVAVGVMDASSAGNCIWYVDLATSKAIGSGDTLIVNSAALGFSQD